MNDIKKILIVGGGSSGWMTAAYLNKAFNTKEEKHIDITLIESSEISTLGVGEATIPIIGSFFAFLGMPEEEWMEQCNATYKLAINFKAWKDGSDSDAYWHTFGQVQGNRGASISVMHYWLQRYLAGDKTPFAKSVHDAVYACELKKNPKPGPTQQLSRAPKIPYAFHLDAGLLVDMLRDFSKKNGVTHLIDQVEHVHLDDRDFIQYIATKEGKMLEADLFIDCSGFQSLLIEKALKVQHQSYSDSLFCDRAIAIGTPYAKGDVYNEQNGGLNSYTTAAAMNAGWTWHTPLRHRDGNGYVYSSRFITDEEAEREFRAALGKNAEGCEARFLKMRMGNMQQFWKNNCLAVGLSAGFIEPLESTGLAMIQIAIRDFIQHFPDKHFHPWQQQAYNRKMMKMYENIKNFIILHYVLTQREDTPFWKAVKNETVLPPKLAQRMEEWKHHWMTERDYESMFGPFNEISILTGMDYLPKTALPTTHFYQTKGAENFFKQVALSGELIQKSYPTQAEIF